MTISSEQVQEIYEAAVHEEATGDEDASFDLLCKLDDTGGTGATIRKLIDMVRACDVDLLAVREAQSEPVQWGSPKTVRQLIQQLQTLDPELETTALLRMPADFRDGKAVRQVPLVISYERMDEQWLAPYNGDGRKVLAFWAKADHRPENERGEVLTTLPGSAVPQSDHLTRAISLAAEMEELADRISAEETQSSGPALPPGFQLVPVEPTEDMVIDGFESEAFNALADAVLDKKGWPYSCRESAECVKGIFKAMLVAAPKAD